MFLLPINRSTIERAITKGDRVHALLPDGSYDRIYLIAYTTATGSKTCYALTDIRSFYIEAR